MTENFINIKGLDKALVLKTLWNNSKCQGLSILQLPDDKIDISAFEELISADRTYFDYLWGKVMKIDVANDILDPTLYDRDNGDGAARNALHRAKLI